MDRREIDLQLQRYTATEHRIASNLHELELHSVYQLLKTDDLIGETARVLNPAFHANPSLWQMFAELEAALSRARAIRGDAGINKENRQALVELFTAPVVVFDDGGIPFGQRSLTGGSSRELRLTLDQLIARMQSVYEPLRDGVARVEEVMRAILPRLDSVAQSTDGLRDTARALSLDASGLDRIERSLSELRARCTADPLSINHKQVDALDGDLRAIRSAIAQAQTSHDSLVTDLVAAGDVLDECRRLREEAASFRAEATRKIATPIGLRAAPGLNVIDGPNGLRERLKPIVAMTGPWQQTRKDLDEWTLIANRLRDQLARVAAANKRPLERRTELRGRLSAFRAKMSAVGMSTDPVLSDLAAEAHNELFTAPTDLSRADRLIGQIGSRLAGATS